MNDAAYKAIEDLWNITLRARSVFPHVKASTGEVQEYASPSWYKNHGFVASVNFCAPVATQEINQIAGFINRSFIITAMAILEESGVVPYRKNPDCLKAGGKHVELIKQLRNRFAHGEWEYDVSISGKNVEKNKETRKLIEELFPEEAAKGEGFITSIDNVLEPLKNGVLDYISDV